MKLPKALLGAILVGITVQTTNCKSDDSPGPESKQKKDKDEKTVPYDCPACGMG